MTNGLPGTLTADSPAPDSLAERNGSVRRQLKALYGPVEEDMRAVEEILRRELRSRYPFVNELVQHGIRLGGKRLRPALLPLTAQACGQVTEDHRLLAAVVEMIHTATLVHDDVLDEAALRRHNETVNARYDNEASVLLGDYLFSHAFYLAATLDSTFACKAIGRSTNIVCQGELLQVAGRGNYDLTETQYLQIIDNKTAELCAVSCLLGARYAGTGAPTQRAMRRYGRRLGLAFQIIDDLLDLLGDEAQTGKSLGTDLEKEKPTLPLIHLLSRVDRSERERVLSILRLPTADRREALLPLLERHESLDYARGRAGDYARRARRELEVLPDSPARDVLAMIPDYVLARRN